MSDEADNKSLTPPKPPPSPPGSPKGKAPMKKVGKGYTDTEDVVLSIDEKNELPHALSSIITQTDRTGKAQKVTDPIYDTPTKKGADTSIFQRIFCCLRPNTTANSKQIETGRYNDGSTAPTTTSPRPQRPMPARMPEMNATKKSLEGKKCLALDLDETLVHSSFRAVPSADYVIPVIIDETKHDVFVIKRPGVDEFLKQLAEHFEIIIYTASLSKYADPLLDKLDINKVIDKRLFRENCVLFEGHFVKDLSVLNREISQTIIVDNSPMSYKFHPDNAIDCSSFIDDPRDVELWQIADFLISIKDVSDVSLHCRSWRKWCREHPSNIPSS